MRRKILNISKDHATNTDVSPDVNFLGTRRYTAIWQTSFWNAMLLKSGQEENGFLVRVSEKDAELVAFFEKRSVGLGKTALFAVGGPIPSVGFFEAGESIQSSVAREFSHAVARLAKDECVVFVQIEPLCDMNIPGFTGKAYKKFIERETLVVNISVEEDEILAQMKEKGRYNVRLAQKRGIVARSVAATDENLDIFQGLLAETLKRDGFAGNSRTFYRAMLDMLEKEQVWGLFFAFQWEEVVAAAIASFVGSTAIYYYGASTSDNEKRKNMPAYLLQWEMMLEGKRRGCEVYDFLGIAPEWSVWHHLEGVTDFKKKFGGEVVGWPEGRVMVVKKGEYLLLRIGRWMRRWIWR